MATRSGIHNWEKGVPNGTRIWNNNETRTLEVETTGDYDTLNEYLIDENIKPGKHWTAGDPYLGVPGTAGFGLLSLTLTHDGAEIGILHLSLVQIENADDPYSVSYEVDMQEVQKSLKAHPSIVSDGEALTQIRLWEDTTSEGKRVQYENSQSGSGEVRFYYFVPIDIDHPESSVNFRQVTNENAIKYLKALLAGIETYNVYLPVVTKSTYYINLPGTLDSATNPTISYSGKIGKFDSPPINISGFESDQFFKSGDKFSRANNGSWTRTEQWVYTNDMTHAWIYRDTSPAPQSS